MLRINGMRIERGSYPDGTLLLKTELLPGPKGDLVVIDWYYEEDAEIFALYALTRHAQRKWGKAIQLFMPYIPNARMDRVKTKDDVFTLKYFAEIINSLSFESVVVLDPHSSVSEALIDRIVVCKPDAYIGRAINMVEPDLLFFPDEGAMKRYAGSFGMPYAFGIKKRDWQTGKILGLDVMGEKELISGRDILIIDDICSRGGTFYHSAKALKELGANNIYLYVTHCENTILEGEVLKGDLIKKVYTTNSICRVEHEKLEVFHI